MIIASIAAGPHYGWAPESFPPLWASLLKPDEYSPLNKASPPDFAYSHIPRVSKKGGGVAMIYEASFSLKYMNTFKTFEIIGMKPPTTLKTSNAITPAPPPSFCIVTLYRPPVPLPGGIC